MQLLQLEAGAVVDVVADLFLVSQDPAQRTRRLRSVQIGSHACVVQVVGIGLDDLDATLFGVFPSLVGLVVG